MESDAMGWPDPKNPGVPENPERDGWHWLHWPGDREPEAAFWTTDVKDEGEWKYLGCSPAPAQFVSKCRYLGPVYTRSDLTAARQEAAAAGAMEMREAAKSVLIGDFDSEMESYARWWRERIEALPVPSAASLAEYLGPTITPAHHAALCEVLQRYADELCEGWCADGGAGCFDDCGGCPAKRVLDGLR